MISSAVRPPSSRPAGRPARCALDQVLVLGGQGQRVAEARPAGDDGDLVDRVGMGSAHPTRACPLVVGDELLLVLGHHRACAPDRRSRGRWPPPAPTCRSGFAAASREQGRLVDQVGQVGTRETGRAAGDTSRSTSSVERLALGVDLEDPFAALDVGASMTIWRSNRPGRSRAGSRMSGRLVAAITITPVLPSKPSISTSSWLSVCSRSSWPPPEAGTTVAPDRVDLVDEDDRGRALPWPARRGRAPGWHRHRRTSRRSRTRRSRRTARRPHRRPPWPAGSCRFREARTAARPWGSWRPSPVLVGVLEEVLDLLELLDRLLEPATSLKVTFGWSLLTCLGLRLAELHDPVPRALHLHEDEDHEPDEEQPRQDPDEDLEEAGRFGVGVDGDPGGDDVAGEVALESPRGSAR
jgi:hypothetical protein